MMVFSYTFRLANQKLTFSSGKIETLAVCEQKNGEFGEMTSDFGRA